MAETYKNAGLAITNSEQDIYQCPAGTAAIVMTLRVTNIDGTNDDNITAKVTDSSNTNIASVAHTISVPADTSLELAGDSKIILEAQDKVRLTGGASSGDLMGFISVVEIT
jgi:hypothetical protein